MGRVSKYKKLNSSDPVTSDDRHDDGPKKVCKSKLKKQKQANNVCRIYLPFFPISIVSYDK